MRQQCLDNAERNRDRTTLLRNQAGHPDRAVNGTPSVATDVEANEEVSRKQGPPHGPETASMQNCFLALRQKRRVSLGLEIELGFGLIAWPRMDKIPTGAWRQLICG